MLAIHGGAMVPDREQARSYRGGVVFQRRFSSVGSVRHDCGSFGLLGRCVILITVFGLEGLGVEAAHLPQVAHQDRN